MVLHCTVSEFYECSSNSHESPMKGKGMRLPAEYFRRLSCAQLATMCELLPLNHQILAVFSPDLFPKQEPGTIEITSSKSAMSIL